MIRQDCKGPYKTRVQAACKLLVGMQSLDWVCLYASDPTNAWSSTVRRKIC